VFRPNFRVFAKRTMCYRALWLRSRVLPMDQAKQRGFWVTTEYLRSELFWDITQRIAVIPYRRFGTTYRVSTSRIKKSKEKSPCGIITSRCVMTQKSADLVYFSAEAWINLSICCMVEEYLVQTEIWVHLNLIEFQLLRQDVHRVFNTLSYSLVMCLG